MPHLPSAHHKTSKYGSPHNTKIKVKQIKCPEFEFKPRQVNDSSQSNQETYHMVSQFPSAQGPHIDLQQSQGFIFKTVMNNGFFRFIFQPKNGGLV
jgi:hypothetical protein